MKENGNNENIQVSKLGNNPGNSYSLNNDENSNSNTKYTDKKLSALPGVKKYKQRKYMEHPFKKFFLLETVDIGGALYVYTLGGVFALLISVVLFCFTKFR